MTLCWHHRTSILHQLWYNSVFILTRDPGSVDVKLISIDLLELSKQNEGGRPYKRLQDNF